jgi:hypothetical protein
MPVSNDLPPPLVEPHVDCTDLDGFMLNTERLMSSELAALYGNEIIGAALMLWCRALEAAARRESAGRRQDQLCIRPPSAGAVPQAERRGHARLRQMQRWPPLSPSSRPKKAPTAEASVATSANLTPHAFGEAGLSGNRIVAAPQIAAITTQIRAARFHRLVAACRSRAHFAQPR